MLEPQAILDRIYEGKKKYIKVYPVHKLRASEIGHPCERYLVYSILNWQDREPHTPELQMIFEGGNLIENMAIKDLEDAGFKVYRPEPDKAIYDAFIDVTGHIDVRVDFGDGRVYTGEIKGLNHIDFDRVNSVEGMLRSKKPWLQKYPAQLMTYLYIKGEERGFFYLKDKLTFRPKIIWVDLDYDYMDGILKKAERVKKHVAERTLPDRVEDIELCEHCPFKHICLPEMARKEMEFIDDQELEQLLELREKLKEAYDEYQQIDKEIKRLIGGREKLIVGNFMITGKWVERKGYTVPDSRYMQYKIARIA